VVVVKIVTDVRRQFGKLMVFQFWPDTASELTGANPSTRFWEGDRRKKTSVLLKYRIKTGEKAGCNL